MVIIEYKMKTIIICVFTYFVYIFSGRFKNLLLI